MYFNSSVWLMMRAFIALCLFCAMGVTASAEVPHMIQYQGRLTDDAGTALDTVVDLTFGVYNDSLGSIKLWEELHPAVTVAGGLFDVLLGGTTAIGKTVIDGSKRWLGISIGGGDILQPMIPIVSSGYALRSQYSDTTAYAVRSDTASYASNARHADTANVALNAGASGWVDAGNFVYLSTVTDSVGIGVSAPNAPLEVEGPMHAIIGNSHGSGTAAGVYGSNDSDGFGLMGISTNGRGVSGISSMGFGGHFFGPKHYFSGNLGIGTETPEEMLHIYKDGSGVSNFLKIQSAHASNWGETGIKFQTPQNLWWLFMDDDANGLCPDGGLGLWNNSQGYMNMIWTKEGHVGIPTYSSQYQFAVYSPGVVGAILGQAVEGIGVHGYSQTGFGGYFYGPKHYFSGNTGFGTDSPTHRVTVNGELALQQSEVTKFHMNYYGGGLNISETTVADYRLFIKAGGNVGIGTNNPTTKLHVAGTLHADAFEADAIGRANIVDEVGIASASYLTGVSLTTSWTSYLSREITVPTSGYILAIGMARVWLEHGVSGYSGAYIAISDMDNSLNGSMNQAFELGSNVSAGTYAATIPCQRLFSVSEGTHTFYLIAERDPDNPAGIGREQMALLFIPTVYASKNGRVSTNPEDILNESVNLANAESELPDPAEPEVPAIKDPATGDKDTSQGQIRSLTAKVEALEKRLQALEKE